MARREGRSDRAPHQPSGTQQRRRREEKRERIEGGRSGGELTSRRTPGGSSKRERRRSRRRWRKWEVLRTGRETQKDLSSLPGVR